jgi:GT2 family glycosyltransferase
MIKVSIVIKTLNEEKNISRAIESSLAAVAPYHSEVVIADSASTDRTIEMAMQFPVTVVQIKNPIERCCGVGPQLGYQYTKGEYIYILDGDMELKPSFLHQAIEILDNEPEVAGVGGYIHEMRVEHLEVQGHINRLDRLRRNRSDQVRCLNGGGLYRRSAIESVGYFSDRNLHAFEEYDLGARLRVEGWRLVKLDQQAVDHYSYEMGTWRVLWHRLHTGRFISSGELLSASIKCNYVKKAASETRMIQIAIGLWFYWALALVISHWLPGAVPIITFFMLALLTPLLAMTIRHRSLKLAVYSILTWHIGAVGFLIGLSRRRGPPADWIECRVLQTVSVVAGNPSALRTQHPGAVAAVGLESRPNDAQK